MGKRQRQTYYAVAVGRIPGVYNSWEECKQQVDKFPGCLFKSFDTKEKANQFMQNGSNSETKKRCTRTNQPPILNFIDLTQKFVKTNPPKPIKIDEVKEEIIPHKRLSPGQQKVLDLVLTSKKNVFFTGSAGTGKSYLLSRIVDGFRNDKSCKEDSIWVTATTGIAAIQIDGITINSYAGIELGNFTREKLLKKAKTKSKRWLKTQVLIIDEISMLSGRLFSDLNFIAKSIRKSTLPFGGIQVIVCGDFFQLPPVKIIEKFCFDVPDWNEVIHETIELTEIFRQREDIFIKSLNEIRHGILSDSGKEMIKSVSRPLSNEFGILPTRLYCKNISVDEENLRELQKINNPSHFYQSTNMDYEYYHQFKGFEQNQLINMLEKSRNNCIAGDCIELKIGAQVMLLKNLGVQDRFVNGARGVIKDFVPFEYDEDNKSFLALNKWEASSTQSRIINSNGDCDDKHVQLYPLVKFTSGKEKIITPVFFGVVYLNREFCYRIQLPLKLAWAITIHKSQGMTLDKVQVDLKSTFASGQAYVAMSRATSLDGLQILSFSEKSIFSHSTVLNYYADACNDPVAKELIANKNKPILKTKVVEEKQTKNQVITTPVVNSSFFDGVYDDIFSSVAEIDTLL